MKNMNFFRSDPDSIFHETDPDPKSEWNGSTTLVLALYNYCIALPKHKYFLFEKVTILESVHTAF